MNPSATDFGMQNNPSEPSHTSFAEEEQREFLSIAVVAVTEHGVRLALQLRAKLPGSVCFVPERHRFALAMGAQKFKRLKDLFPAIWDQYRGLICIMATGIVVRLIAPLLRHKKTDPAVVVMDERGQFVISLLSGHLGGANRLATRVARLTGGLPVITTASDVQHKPAWDLIAQEAGLEIENIEMLPRLARAVLEEEPVEIYDPENRIPEDVKRSVRRKVQGVKCKDIDPSHLTPYALRNTPCVWVCERDAPSGSECLKLRPRNLVVGIGCNRGTPAEEILEHVRTVFEREKLSLLSIRNLTSIDLKKDEPGLLDAAKTLGRPIFFYPGESVKTVTVPNPSPVVATHIGVPSVCEATALLSAQSDRLIVPKQKTPNVTLAVAKVAFPS